MNFLLANYYHYHSVLFLFTSPFSAVLQVTEKENLAEFLDNFYRQDAILTCPINSVKALKGTFF